MEKVPAPTPPNQLLSTTAQKKRFGVYFMVEPNKQVPTTAPVTPTIGMAYRKGACCCQRLNVFLLLCVAARLDTIPNNGLAVNFSQMI